MKEIKQVLIVGGGTAGWLTAAILARKLSSVHADHIQVTLVESPDIATIGVGEGTFPTMVETLKYIGISESEFMRKCTATFKQAIKFVNWEQAPVSGKDNYYYHLFDAPFKVANIDLPQAWLRGHKSDTSYAHAVAGQAAVCDAGRGPKKLTTPPYVGLTKYAYHLDAGKFVELLTEHCVNRLGVRHLNANVESVKLDQEGFVVAVGTRELGELNADFFVDCTGFSSLLLGGALQVPFVNKNKVLLVGHAVTMQVPYATENAPIVCHTISTAKNAGWIWDIGLSERRGIGYVYSSAHTDHDSAEQTLRNYIGVAAEQLTSRKLNMQVGYREKMWEKNCVAIGLSSGFMEPLEATAIAMVESAAFILAEQFPRTFSAMAGTAAKYNQIFTFRWEKIVDFIKLHYFISKRRDSDFWIENTKEASAPAGLLEKLSLWQSFIPVENDFPNRFELFSLASYQYILYGMNFLSKLPQDNNAAQTTMIAQKAFLLLDEKIKIALQELPDHRQLIKELYKNN